MRWNEITSSSDLDAFEDDHNARAPMRRSTPRQVERDQRRQSRPTTEAPRYRRPAKKHAA